MAKITLIEICCFILTVATINIKLIYYIRTCSVAEGSPLPLSTTRMIIVRPGEFSSKSIFNTLVLSFIYKIISVPPGIVINILTSSWEQFHKTFCRLGAPVRSVVFSHVSYCSKLKVVLEIIVSFIFSFQSLKRYFEIYCPIPLQTVRFNIILSWELSVFPFSISECSLV